MPTQKLNNKKTELNRSTGHKQSMTSCVMEGIGMVKNVLFSSTSVS
jgi:hypothetical protein